MRIIQKKIFHNSEFSKTLVLFIFSTLISVSVLAQNDTIHYEIEASGVVSTGSYAPFWIQSNQYGKISSLPNSANLMAGVSKNYSSKKQLFDYGFKADALFMNDAEHHQVYFHELYAKARFSVLGFWIGKREELYGPQDSTLSSGGFIFSGNAQPIPQIYAGIPQFAAVPLTRGYLEIKGGISHGWLNDNVYIENAYLHHTYMYLRVGGKLPVKLQYGVDHFAQWGGNLPGKAANPSGFSDFVDVFFGKSGGSDANRSDQINALGNHLISQNLKLEASYLGFKLNAYWQNLSEDGPIRIIWKTMNVTDGLWGISLKNKNFPYVSGILYEFFNTTDQSGPYHDKDGIVYGGADSYFKNSIYQEGWNYYHRTIGNPFITSTLYNTDGKIQPENDRVRVHHFGMEGKISEYNYRFLASFSTNYGTYSSTYSPPKKSSDFYLNVNKYYPNLWGIRAGITVASDFGKMYGNGTGFMITLQKTGSLLTY